MVRIGGIASPMAYPDLAALLHEQCGSDFKGNRVSGRLVCTCTCWWGARNSPHQQGRAATTSSLGYKCLHKTVGEGPGRRGPSHRALELITQAQPVHHLNNSSLLFDRRQGDRSREVIPWHSLLACRPGHLDTAVDELWRLRKASMKRAFAPPVGRRTCSSVVAAPTPPGSRSKTTDFPFWKQGVIFATATSPSATWVYDLRMLLQALTSCPCVAAIDVGICSIGTNPAASSSSTPGFFGLTTPSQSSCAHAHPDGSGTVALQSRRSLGPSHAKFSDQALLS